MSWSPPVRSRRFFLKGVSLSAGAALLPPVPAIRSKTPPPRPLVKPRALKPGDTIGLVTPSSYLWDPWKLETVATRLEAALGLKSCFGT